jgi:hypothetical protein
MVVDSLSPAARMADRSEPSPLQRLAGPILLGLLLLMIVVVLLPGTVERRVLLMSIVIVLLTLAFAVRWLMDLHFGWAATRTNRWYSRAREPGAYWMLMTVNGVLTLLAASLAIRMFQ